MRILIVNQHIENVIGGSEIQCDLIARGMVKRGHEVLYVAPCGDKRINYNSAYKVCQVSRNASKILKAILKFSPDIVYWRFNKNFFRQVVTVLHKKKIPVVFAVSHINDVTLWKKYIAEGRGLKGKAFKFYHTFLNRWQYGGFKYVSALTSLNEEYLPLSPVSPVYYVPNAMSAGGVDFVWARPYCVWVANIKPQKRPESAIALAKALESKGVDLIMVGAIQSGEYQWMEEPDKLPINCHYLGVKTPAEVNGILSKSLFHIHTCTPEGFGNIFIQAWLQGKPSVSLGFDPGGALQGQRIGYVANDDEATFRDQVLTLIDNESDCLEKGQKARAFAQKTFSPNTLTENVERVLQETIETYHERN